MQCVFLVAGGFRVFGRRKAAQLSVPRPPGSSLRLVAHVFFAGFDFNLATWLGRVFSYVASPKTYRQWTALCSERSKFERQKFELDQHSLTLTINMKTLHALDLVCVSPNPRPEILKPSNPIA